MNIKRTLTASKVSVPEFAKLCCVTKNMVYKWMKGSSPHALRIDRVNKMLAAIDRAVEDGDLPLQENLRVREKQIQAVVISNIKKAV